jgi:hypothetical protein
MVAGSTDWKGWEPNVPFEGMNPWPNSHPLSPAF